MSRRIPSVNCFLFSVLFYSFLCCLNSFHSVCGWVFVVVFLCVGLCGMCVFAFCVYIYINIRVSVSMFPKKAKHNYICCTTSYSNFILIHHASRAHFSLFLFRRFVPFGGGVRASCLQINAIASQHLRSIRNMRAHRSKRPVHILQATIKPRAQNGRMRIGEQQKKETADCKIIYFSIHEKLLWHC